MTAPESRLVRVGGASGRAQARSRIARIRAGLTAIGVLSVPVVARLRPPSVASFATLRDYTD